MFQVCSSHNNLTIMIDYENYILFTSCVSTSGRLGPLPHNSSTDFHHSYGSNQSLAAIVKNGRFEEEVIFWRRFWRRRRRDASFRPFALLPWGIGEYKSGCWVGPRNMGRIEWYQKLTSEQLNSESVPAGDHWAEFWSPHAAVRSNDQITCCICKSKCLRLEIRTMSA